MSFSSCSQNDEKEIEENSILGTWKLVERIESGDDGLPIWQAVGEEQSYTYTFFEEGMLKSSRYNCNGTYELGTLNILHLEFDCNDGRIKGNLKYEFKNANLILTPEPNSCDEGCDEKFEKVRE